MIELAKVANVRGSPLIAICSHKHEISELREARIDVHVEKPIRRAKIIEALLAALNQGQSLKRLLDDVDVRITDGEVHLRAPMLLRCYRDGTDPRTTDGWFPTGDLGELTDDERLDQDPRYIGQSETEAIAPTLEAWKKVAAKGAVAAINKLDPTRPVTYASNHPFDDLCLDLVDVIAINCYPGWYRGEIAGIPEGELTPRVRAALESLMARFLLY